jgi:sugar/nucleoside kinase (ribokinase family)
MDVICAGILVADAFAQPIAALPAAGELKTTEGFLMSAGGCAANVAVALRRMGRTVTVAGKVGDDIFGSFVIGELARQGIGTEYVRRSARHSTSATVIINVTGEDRRYLHCIGANGEFNGADVEPALIERAQALYVGGYLAMPAFGPKDLKNVMAGAKSCGMITVLDVVVPGGSSRLMEQVGPALQHTDYFLPNGDEAAALTGFRTVERQAEALAEEAPGCTHVITLGEGGLYTQRGREIIVTAPYRMNSLDESGAGDAFAAGLITGILEGWPLERTLAFGSVVGASCTRALGCSAGVFTFQEALAYLEQEPALGFGGGRA